MDHSNQFLLGCSALAAISLIDFFIINPSAYFVQAIWLMNWGTTENWVVIKRVLDNAKVLVAWITNQLLWKVSVDTVFLYFHFIHVCPFNPDCCWDTFAGHLILMWWLSWVQTGWEQPVHCFAMFWILGLGSVRSQDVQMDFSWLSGCHQILQTWYSMHLSRKRNPLFANP